MRVPRLLLPLVLLAAVLLGPVAPAASANTTIDFDALTHGTDIDTEYTAEGVTFSTSSPATTLPSIYTLGANAHSGSNVLLASHCKTSSEFCGDIIRGDFTELHQLVSVWVGNLRSGNSGTVTLTAYDALGNVVDSKNASPVGGGAFNQQLTILSPTANILYFTVGTLNQQARIGLDDLTFDTAAVSTPTFGIARAEPFLDAGITKGTTQLMNIVVTRTGSSTGNIDFSVSGLPAGVTGTFSPNPYATAGPGSGTVALTLSAAPSAPAGTSPSTVTVIATPASPTAGSGARTFTFPLIVRPTYDAQITTIEVTQGIQEFDLPERTDTSATSTLAYDGVPLAAKKKTVVRVFANLAAGPSAGIPGTIVALYGVRGASPLPGSPLLPEWGERRLTIGGPYPSYASERLNPNGAFTFTLPDTWTKSGSITLKAVLSGPNGVFGSTADECASCRANNTFNLTDVPFTAMGQPEFTTVSLEYTKAGTRVIPRSPSSVFARFQELAPFGDGDLFIPPYEASIDITDLANQKTVSYFDFSCVCLKQRAVTSDDLNTAALNRVESYELRRRERDNSLGSFITVGVNTGVARGLHRRITIPDLDVAGIPILARGSKSVAVVEQKRPYTSVAHEVWHAFGAAHASTCTNGSNPKRTDDWPPDQKGYLQGVGLDTWNGSGGALGPYRVVGVGTPKADTQWFDLMSYCASETDSWISPRNWRRVVSDFRAVSRSATRRATRARATARAKVTASARTEVLVVSAYSSAEDGELVLTSVERYLGDAPTPNPLATYQLIGRDANGAVVATSPMTVTESPAADGETMYLFRGAVLASGIARVDIQRASTIVATRSRSAHAPTLRVTSPVAGATVGGARSVAITWSAADRDRDALTATIEYSADGGRTWKAVFVGPSTGLARLAASTLPRSTNARLRVTVNDGFLATSALSARFVSLGANPTAVLLSPRPGLRTAQDSTLYLAGQGFGDGGAALPATRLRWFLGTRFLGAGARVSATGLTAGRQTLRLVVTDAFGRSAVASAPVTVTPVRPRFTTLVVPRAASRSASRVTIKVAAHVPATLVVGRQRFMVGRTASSVTVAIPRGTTTVALVLRLASGRQASTVRRTITRT
jgi:hypothetical protein